MIIIPLLTITIPLLAITIPLLTMNPVSTTIGKPLSAHGPNRDPPRELLDSADEQKRHELMQADEPWQGNGHGKEESSQNAKRSFITCGSVSKPCTPVVHIKIAGKWMFIPLKMVLIGIDPYPHVGNFNLRNRPTARI